MVRLVFAACLLAGWLAAQDGADRDRKWREDTDYVAAQLTQTHPSLFSRVSQADFDQAVSDLRSSISSKSDPQIIAGLSHILALARDGHTDLNLFQANTGFRLYGIRVRWFSDGLFVIQAAGPYARAIGKRVVSIGGAPIESAYLAVREFISYENDPFARYRSENLLASPEALQAAGVIESAGPAVYEFEEQDGGTFKLTINTSASTLLTPHPAEPLDPLNLRSPQLNYWFHYLSEARALYFKYNACAESAVLPIKEFTARMISTMRSRPVDRVIFDLRHNGGGADSILRGLLEDLGAAILAGEFKLPAAVVITSRSTYSSAVNNTWDLKSAGAVLVGENTGGLPAGAEIRGFTMPNSRLAFRSTAWLKPTIEGTFIPVDVAVDFSSGDFFGERDPYLDAALAVEAKLPVFAQAARKR